MLVFDREITFVGVGSKTLWTGHTMKIERKIPHEGYNGVTLANNIGLIKLEKKITYNDSIASVRLAVQNQPLPNTTVSVSGWDSPGVSFSFFVFLTEKNRAFLSFSSLGPPKKQN